MPTTKIGWVYQQVYCSKMTRQYRLGLTHSNWLIFDRSRWDNNSVWLFHCSLANLLFWEYKRPSKSLKITPCVDFIERGSSAQIFNLCWKIYNISYKLITFVTSVILVGLFVTSVILVGLFVTSVILVGYIRYFGVTTAELVGNYPLKR